MGFKDHFSGHARDYAAARPTYPPALFDWLAGQCEGRALAWDADCGNGQSALALAVHIRLNPRAPLCRQTVRDSGSCFQK